MVTSDRLAAEMFMLETGTKMVDVPYKGGGVALGDMMAGTTQVMGPFREYREAATVWREQAMATRYRATMRYTIVVNAPA